MSLKTICTAVSLVALLLAGGCATVKYNTLEKFGIHKRDILVDNVEDTRDAQKAAQKEFKDALKKFESIVGIEETSLKKAYDTYSREYEQSKEAAEEVSESIRDVEDVAEDLFSEWKKELKQYSDPNLKSLSEKKMNTTRARYDAMHRSMIESERSMKPVLQTMHDNVLFLKHNLNAQAIGALRLTFGELQNDIEYLLVQLNHSIEDSNEFIKNIEKI